MFEEILRKISTKEFKALKSNTNLFKQKKQILKIIK